MSLQKRKKNDEKKDNEFEEIEKEEELVESIIKDLFTMRNFLGVIVGVSSFIIIFDNLSTFIYAIVNLFYSSFWLMTPTWTYTFNDFIYLLFTVGTVLALIGMVYLFVQIYYKIKKMYIRWKERRKLPKMSKLERLVLEDK